MNPDSLDASSMKIDHRDVQEKLNKKVFNVFDKTEYNTYGTLYGHAGPWKLYSGNFWWMKASYAKTINLDLNQSAVETTAKLCQHNQIK